MSILYKANLKLDECHFTIYTGIECGIQHIHWNRMGSISTSSMQMENIHWNHLFHSTLKDLENKSSYFISKKGSYIKDLTTNDYHSISFREGLNRHKLGFFQRDTRNKIKDLVHPFTPLQTKKRFQDWNLVGLDMCFDVSSLWFSL